MHPEMQILLSPSKEVLQTKTETAAALRRSRRREKMPQGREGEEHYLLLLRALVLHSPWGMI